MGIRQLNLINHFDEGRRGLSIRDSSINTKLFGFDIFKITKKLWRLKRNPAELMYWPIAFKSKLGIMTLNQHCVQQGVWRNGRTLTENLYIHYGHCAKPWPLCAITVDSQ